MKWVMFVLFIFVGTWTLAQEAPPQLPPQPDAIPLAATNIQPPAPEAEIDPTPTKMLKDLYFPIYGRLFVPILVALMAFVLKITWDVYSAQRKRKIDLLEKKLSEFYWPIAIRFQQIQEIWKKMFEDKNNPQSRKARIGSLIRNKIILEKHNEIVEIIESGIHVVEPSTEFRELIGKYLKHVAIYNAIVSSGIEDQFPVNFGAKFPSELIPQIEETTQTLQDQLNSYLKRRF